MVNFHHLLAFMIMINKKVKFTCCCLADSYELPPQIYTVNIHDASGECKTAENLKLHLEKAIKTVRNAYMAHVVGVVMDASGECWKAHRLLSLEYPDIVFLDCYAHQVSFFVFVCPHTNHVVQINLMVGDYFKSKAGVLEFADQASELITWLHSKTLILALTGSRGGITQGVNWEFLTNIPSICPLGKLRIFWRFISHFALNKPSG